MVLVTNSYDSSRLCEFYTTLSELQNYQQNHNHHDRYYTNYTDTHKNSIIHKNLGVMSKLFISIRVFSKRAISNLLHIPLAVYN